MSTQEWYDWITLFDERERKEIEFALTYARDFHHGTNGHNALMIIAKMAQLLNDNEKKLRKTKANEQ